jgi:hypothetical protein
LMIKEFDIRLKIAQPDSIFDKIDIESLHTVVFDEEDVRLFNCSWKLEIMEKENTLVLHCEHYRIYFKMSFNRGYFYTIEDFSTGIDGDESNLPSEEDGNDCDGNGESEVMIGLLFIVTPPTLKDKKSLATYTPPVKLCTTTLDIISERSGKIHSKPVQFLNYNSLHSYFNTHTSLVGLYMRKSDNTQYNCTGSFKGCKLVVAIVSDEKIGKVPEIFI